MQGLMAFYKGFLPNFGRIGSWNVVMFLTLEQVSIPSVFLTFQTETFFHYICSNLELNIWMKEWLP